MSKSQVSHNLDIQTYSFHEILQLFDLNSDFKLTELKRAKNKVLYLHPDKSKLPPQYFLFYKRAFEIVVQYYEERTKQEREIPAEPIQYTPHLQRHHVPDTEDHRKIAQAIQKQQKSEQFNSRFNELFDQNMSHKPDPTRNQWFTNTEATYVAEEVANPDGLGRAMSNIKSQVATNALSRYRGIENMQSSQYGTNFYEDEDGADSGYISADIFSRLKFDDLRRVHKDETVLAVSEQDYNPITRAQTFDQMNMQRSAQDLTPLEKSSAETILAQQQREHEQRMYQRLHQAKLRTMEYEEKNKAVLANFMQIKDR